MNIKLCFEEILSEHGPKHWSFAARKDMDFITAVNLATTHLPDDLSFSERVYCAVNDYDPRCENGSRKKLVSIPKGWSFCGPAGRCECARQVISQKSRDNVDHEARLAKTRSTLLERYGTTNPADLPQAREAHQKYYADRRVDDPPVEKKPIRQSKPRVESDERLSCMVCGGAYKQITHCHLRTHGMTVSEYQTSFPDAPLAIAAIQDRRSQSSSGRVLSQETRDKISKMAMGHKRNVGQVISADHREKISLGKFHGRADIQSFLTNKEELSKKLTDMSIPEIAEELGISHTTIYDHIRRNGIEREPLSSYEAIISKFLNDSDISFDHNSYKILSTMEKKSQLDFYLPDHNLGIEFNGIYWHSDRVVEKNYHRDKWQRCQDVGVRLLMINEDEWIARSDVIKKKILNLCGKSDRGCGGRKLRVGKISNKEALGFVDLHHIQGRPAMCSMAWGAFWDEELVAAITLARQRGTGHLDLSRFCSDGRVFAGLFSKMLKSIRREITEPIVTFADLRYSDGGLYEKCGFINEGMIPPDYRYVKGCKTFHKSLFTKAQIAKKFGIDMAGKTERQAMEELGYSRIYDCGKIRFRLT